MCTPGIEMFPTRFLFSDEDRGKNRMMNFIIMWLRMFSHHGYVLVSLIKRAALIDYPLESRDSGQHSLSSN